MSVTSPIPPPVITLPTVRRGIIPDNFGLLLNSVTSGELFGQQNILTVGLIPTVEKEVDANYQNLSGNEGALTAADAELSINAPIYARDQRVLTEKLSGSGRHSGDLCPAPFQRFFQ